MNKKDLNKIASIENAIKDKYGAEAIVNPKSNWTEEKEKQYLEQMKEHYDNLQNNYIGQEKVDVNGIKMSKKLLNRESLKSCPVCGSFPKSSMDDVCLVKFDCCNICYIKYVEDREERWLKDGDQMKINKTRFKEIIKEEVAKMGTGQLGQQSVDQRNAMRQGGIDDKERAAIATVSKKLALAAKSGNILGGTLATRLQQLVAEIDKLLGSSQPSQPTQQGAQE